MEDQVRPAAMTPRPRRQRAAGGSSPRPSTFCFLANLGWLLLLLPGFATRADTAIDFWQIYFLTLPHRWITLVLVVADPDRRGGQTRTARGRRGAGRGARRRGAFLGTGAFLCLAMVDYVWNAWHFASQHAASCGCTRARWAAGGSGSSAGECAGSSPTPRSAPRDGQPGGLRRTPARSWLRAIDLAVLVVPAALLLTNLVGASRDRVGKLAYLPASACSTPGSCSVCGSAGPAGS